MFAQILLAILVLLIPVALISCVYIQRIQGSYVEQGTANARQTLSIHVQNLDSRMAAAEAYFAADHYNNHQLRLRSAGTAETYRLAADLYWQELNRQVVYGTAGADAYYFCLPDRNYADVAVRTAYSGDRPALKNWLLENCGPGSLSNGWSIREIGTAQWLLYITRTDGVYFGAFLNLTSVEKEIRDDIAYAREQVFLEETRAAGAATGSDSAADSAVGKKTALSASAASLSAPESRESIRIEQPLSKRGFTVVLLLDKREVSMQLPSPFFFLLLMVFLLLLAAMLLGLAFSKILVRPVQKLVHAMDELENGNSGYRVDPKGENRDAERLNRHFNRMADSLTDMRIQVYEKELERMDTEATNLRLQVNPHFILNSLNIIFSMAKSGGSGATEQIRSFTKYLADYLRFSLRHTGGKVPLRQEMQCVENYLALQKVRFPGRFLYLCDMDDELGSALIPPLLIQNFVENSIKYALNPERQTEIYVVAAKSESRLRISVCDTGNGMEAETVAKIMDGEVFCDAAGKHIGIWNCRRRMKLLYGDDAEFRMTSRPQEGTQVYLDLPFEETES